MLTNTRHVVLLIQNAYAISALIACKIDSFLVTLATPCYFLPNIPIYHSLSSFYPLPSPPPFHPFTPPPPPSLSFPPFIPLLFHSLSSSFFPFFFFSHDPFIFQPIVPPFSQPTFHALRKLSSQNHNFHLL